MKKIFNSKIFIFLLGVTLSATISVVASNISASEITYNNTTLDRAMDELYTKASTYKNLNTATDVTSSKLLDGVKAYSSDGTLVTGNISTFTPTSSYTPTTSEQTLSTNGKYVDGDIKINAIPSSYQETINQLQSQLDSLTTAATSFNFNITSQVQTFNLGFQPKYISCLVLYNNDGYFSFNYNEDFNSKVLRLTSKGQNITETSTSDALAEVSKFFTINSNGFSWNLTASSWVGQTVYCTASK